MRVIAYVPDLMDRSRISSVVPSVSFVATVGRLADDAVHADLVVVDLGRPGVIDVVGSLAGPRVVGFTRHDDTETIRAGRDAGVEVLIRSDFFADVAGHLS